MSPRNNVSLRVFGVLILAMIGCQSVNAQNDDSELGEDSEYGEELIEEVMVTGSHIRRKSTYDTTTPVQILDRSEIIQSGAATVMDVASNLPINYGSELNNEQNDLAGTTQFNLRGLGVASTLTLINGRRGGSAAVADNGGNFFYDVNQLPLSMIERVEVQTDGASAIYGSQAVAGVVNIITRKGFEGFELSARYEEASNEAGHLSMAMGSWNDRGGINLYATIYHQTSNNRTDFSWLRERTNHVGDLQNTRFSSSNGAPGTYFRSVTDPLTGLPIQLAGAQAFADPDCLAAGQVLRGNTCRHIFADQNGVVHESTRAQAFVEFEFAFTDAVEAFGEISFSHNETNRLRGPGNYSNGLITGDAIGRILVPGDHPFNFFIEDPSDPAALVYIGPADWDNTIHQGVDLSCRCRVLGNEFNGKNSPADRRVFMENFRAVGGLKIDFNDVWRLEASYMASINQWDQSTPMEYSAPVVNRLVLDGLFNPFGTRVANPDLISPKDGTSIAGLADDVFALLLTNQVQRAQHDEYVIDAIVSGELFEMPAGPVGFAAGYQHRKQDFEFEPGLLEANGVSGLRGTSFPISGGLEVDAFFAEAILPVTDDIELQLAARYEDYGFTDTTDPKIAIRWNVNDTLALRASLGTSFQAPSIRQTSEARASAIIDDPVGVDPVTGLLGCNEFGQAGSTATRTVGSDDISPQSAESLNIGAIFQPVDSVRLALDYWSYDYSDLISADEGAQAIVTNDCDDGIPNDPRVERTPGGNIVLISSNFINTSSVKTDGLDIAMNYAFETDSLGSFGLGLSATYINSFDFKNSPTSPSQDAVGSRNELNQFSSIPKWRGNVTMDWALNQFYGNATVRYTDSYLNDAADDFKIDEFVALDLQLGSNFELFEDAPSNIIVGVRNLFDEDPPSLGDLQRPGYDPKLAEIRGRILYIELKQSFF